MIRTSQEQKNKLLTCYDFTIPKYNEDLTDSIKDWLKTIAKKWTFQEEKGDTGYEHYQGRINLIKRKRYTTMIRTYGSNKTYKGIHWSITAEENKDTFFYTMKEETRIKGPYTDEDEQKKIYIPRQYRDKMKNLRPFQKTILDSKDIFEDRVINMIYCPNGNKGKSTIASIMELFYNGIDLPIVNDAEKLIQSCCNICMSKNIRNPSPIFIDLPRAMDKHRLTGIYTAIEQIKKGKLYDVRHKYKSFWIDSPQIWVFSNVEPYMNYLSSDRWKIWTINEQYELQKYILTLNNTPESSLYNETISNYSLDQ